MSCNYIRNNQKNCSDSGYLQYRTSFVVQYSPINCNNCFIFPWVTNLNNQNLNENFNLKIPTKWRRDNVCTSITTGRNFQHEDPHSAEAPPGWLNWTQPNIIYESDFNLCTYTISIANQCPVRDHFFFFNTCITFTDLRTGSFHLAPISEEQYHHKQDSNGSVRSGIFLFLLGSVTRAISVVRSPYMCCSCFCVPSRLPFFIFIRRDFTAAI